MIMWTMFKKEWRENVLYVATAFVIVMLVLDYTAYAFYNWSFLGISSSLLGKRIQSSASQNWQTLPTLENSWKVLCMSTAVGLGVWQISTEHLHQTWALLMQLPIPREKILYAKLLAGITFLAAIFLPAGLLIVLRLSTPGVWPGPVYVMGFLPLLLHFLAAMVCYLITILFTLAPSQSFGNRLFSAIAATLALVLAKGLIERFRVYGGLRNEHDDVWIWILSGITLLVAVMCLCALRSVARTREY
jgi:ABC-type transport system involved in multi-copper enzyme maturation permease subunit